jgi:hypothetical protein
MGMVATYVYRDEVGVELFQKLRYVPKRFVQRRPEGNGFVYDLDGVRRVPYLLPELLAGVSAGRHIFVVEGEKAADCLVRFGLVSTCGNGGAGKWHYTEREHFKGAHVVALADNDDPGRGHALDVARSLTGLAEDVRLVELPGLPAKGDVYDWFERGHTVEELKVLVRNTPAFGADDRPPQKVLVTGWPVLEPAALNGLAGEVVRAIEPETEADPAALLATFLTAFGNAVGPAPHARAGSVNHPPRLFTLIVGETARSRKGTSWADVSSIMDRADPGWAGRVLSGFGSGEAIIDAVRDPQGDDPGADDKRVTIRESEFARFLRVMSRQGSTLGPIFRDAWDGERLSHRTVGKGVKVATGAHISAIAHVTRDELGGELLDVDIANGFINRFLPVLARRSRRLPSGGNLDKQVVAELGVKVRSALENARKVGRLTRTPEADKRWSDWYMNLPEDVYGVFGAVTARAEAQVLRLSVAYALLDGSRTIGVPHLEAALAFWRCCEASARYLFESRTGDRVADKILEALLRAKGKGLDRKQQYSLFSRHMTAARLDEATERLMSLGLARQDTDNQTGGRPRTVLIATCEERDTSESSPELARGSFA